MENLNLLIPSTIGGAALVTGIVTIIVLVVNSILTFIIHKDKLKSDIHLAESKFKLDRELADWKRRTELAEQVLTDFYKARDIFSAARSPFAFRGEGITRPGRDPKAEKDASAKDAIYAPIERLNKELSFLSEMHSRRFRFIALFGDATASPFLTFSQCYNQISSSVRALIDDKRNIKDDSRQKHEENIGWVLGEKDEIAIKINDAVKMMESICKPIIDGKK